MQSEQSARLPSLRSVLTSREVEDPVNVWVHRPLAYAFVAAIFRTRITPNQVTFLAMTVGIVAGALWVWGTREAMVAGAILVWVSAILDGADGILARAKRLQSEFGRALDGSADMVVAACTVLPAFWYIYDRSGDPMYLWLGVPAIVLTVLHLYMYDFYKESYLRQTRVEKGGAADDPADVETKLAALEASKGSLLARLVTKHLLLPMVRTEVRLVALTNPGALREGVVFIRNEQTAAIYRQHNLGPMRLWALISLSPHTYIMAICALADHLELYLWIRLVGMNVVFLVVLAWQRWATSLTLRDLSDVGATPIPGPAARAV